MFLCIIILFFVHLSCTVTAQTIADISKNKEATSHRDIITHFFNVQAGVRYVYQTTLNAQETAIAWSADGENGQMVSFINLSNPEKVIKVSVLRRMTILPLTKKYLP
ncbi:hypothetical protein FC093_03005 [Ilyomonas limi]|uniref:Uncharacterized protein n=1 Tax=Ilyomonas limi TaxID=2575867 RepID=A0A4U3L9C6_9BACT|nr:hypothetical protein [Ilyomonas limi]TKK71995.1 hypothetical protein FC093_03005 [Ilyomonas limi]